MPQAAAPQPLAYAPPPPWYRRRRWRRWALLGLLLAIAAAGWNWHEPACRRAQIVYWQRRCMKTAPPADGQTAIYDPLKAAASLKGRDFIAPAWPVWRGPPITPLACWHPEAWTRLRRLYGPAGGPHLYWDDETVVFLGARSAPESSPRLVVLSYMGPPSQGLILNVHVIRPASLWHEPHSRVQTLSLLRMASTLDLSAGRADPNDLSHIVIPYLITHRGVSARPGPTPLCGTLDLWLQQNDTLRPGPLPP